MEKYKSIYKDLYYKIKSNEIAVGSKLKTENELAEEYGVSKITVKTALNLLKEDGLVLRKKRLGTVVIGGATNPNAEKLVAIIYSDFDNVSFRLINGLKEIATDKNVNFSFFDSRNNTEKEREILNYLLTKNIAGLILMPITQGDNIDVISMFAVQKIPVVFMDFASHPSYAPTVTSDNFGGMHEIVSFLIRSGHKRIGFFPYSNSFLPTEQARFEGYTQALIENGIPLNRDYLFTTTVPSIHSILVPSDRSDLKAAGNFYKQYDSLTDKPTAVVCVNDSCAHVIIEVGKSRGVRVPEDLSVTGFDNLAFAVTDNLTTAAQNFAEISKTAFLTLLRQIERPAPKPITIKIHTVLIKRDSVKKLENQS